MIRPARGILNPMDWRRETFVGMTTADPESRLGATGITENGGYDDLTFKAGDAQTTADEGIAAFRPFRDLNGRQMVWSKFWTPPSIRVRLDPTRIPSLTSGLCVVAGYTDGTTTLVGEEYIGGGQVYTGSSILIRRANASAGTPAGSASGGGATSILTVIDFNFGAHTTANRRRLLGITGSSYDVSAQRVGNAHESSGLSVLPTGDAYLFLAVFGLALTGADITIGVEIATNWGEADVLGVAR